MPTLYILCGKLTPMKEVLARKLSQNFVMSTGDYFSEEILSNWCIYVVEIWMNYQQEFIAVNSLFSDLNLIKPYIHLAQIYGYECLILNCEEVLKD